MTCPAVTCTVNFLDFSCKYLEAVQIVSFRQIIGSHHL